MKKERKSGGSSRNSQTTLNLKDVERTLSDLTVDSHVYIVLHSIDGSSLQSEEFQKILASIASLKNVHFVASMDKVNSMPTSNYKSLNLTIFKGIV